MHRTPLRNLDVRSLLLKNLSDMFSNDSFTTVLAKFTLPKNTESQDFTNPDIENLLKDSQVEKGSDCFQQWLKFNKELIKKLFHRRHTLKELKKSLRAVIQSLYSDGLTLDDFLNSLKEKPDRVSYFLEKGLSNKDARACALALSFYTGLPSKTNVQGEIFERMNRNIRFNHLANQKETCSHYMVIISFLYIALSHIPTYSGSCIRAVDLKDEEKHLYKPGSIVNWINFSSSSQGNQPAAPFIDKNTYFIIQSINGRSIVPFSNFPEENEILFHPCSTFFVVKEETQGDKTLIYLRQTELGMSDNTILWVDDKIFNENWEYKPLFDRLCGQAHQYGFRVIPKSSTAQAQNFLESPFGRFNRTNNQSFQVITSMRRLNEKKGKRAGLNFAEWLKRNKYHLELALLSFYSDGSFNTLVNEENAADYAVIKSSSELESYLQDRIKPKDQIWNCSLNDQNIYNKTIQQTPLPEEEDGNEDKGEGENQTPDGGILITPTPEAEALHHLTLMNGNPTPGDSINNLSMILAGIDSWVNTPGKVDCSQEDCRFLLIEEQGQQKIGGGQNFDYNDLILPSN